MEQDIYCNDYVNRLNEVQSAVLNDLLSKATDTSTEAFKKQLSVLHQVNSLYPKTMDEKDLAQISKIEAEAKKLKAEAEMMVANHHVNIASTNAEIELKQAQASKIDKETELMESKTEAELAKLYTEIETNKSMHNAQVKKLRAETKKIEKETKVIIRSKTMEKIADSYVVPVVKGVSKAAFGMLVLGCVNRFESYDSYSGSRKDIARQISSLFIRKALED